MRAKLLLMCLIVVFGVTGLFVPNGIALDPNTTKCYDSAVAADKYFQCKAMCQADFVGYPLRDSYVLACIKGCDNSLGLYTHP
jgi:hypothetical protein